MGEAIITRRGLASTGNATISDVRSGSTFSNASSTGLTGTAIIASGNATTSQVASGYTFSNATAAGLTGTAIISTGNATTADVATGKTFSNASAAGLTGTMTPYKVTTSMSTTPSNGVFIINRPSDLTALKYVAVLSQSTYQMDAFICAVDQNYVSHMFKHSSSSETLQWPAETLVSITLDSSNINITLYYGNGSSSNAISLLVYV